MILLDRGRVDTFQLAFREDAEQVPAEIERGVDIPILVESLVDELLLKIVRETQVELVPGGESFFTDDGDKVTEASSLRIRIVELVGDFPVILSCPTLSNSFFHQT